MLLLLSILLICGGEAFKVEINGRKMEDLVWIWRWVLVTTHHGVRESVHGISVDGRGEMLVM